MRNQSRQWVLTLCLLGLWLLSSGLPLLSPASVANAQEGENLLLNPYFDHGYSPVANGIAPTHWSVWGNADNSDKEGLGTLTHSPPYSWRFRKEWGLFTGGGYYTATVQPGPTYEFSLFAMIWTCDDEERACRSEDSTFSHTDSGGRVRIGIDPTGGTNPHSGNIRWSEWRAPFTWGVFDYITVQATATGSQMTVFTYYTADKAMRWHDVFWDDAALRAVSPANPPDNQDDDNT
ncbi:MAG: hypothetical protein GYB66_12530, partial [Chloroflexi bacterium]|nr:hypothetical protein [Chloroflexota bacterium]